MSKSKAIKYVTVRTAEDLGRALGLSAADTAEMEFRSGSPSHWRKSFKQDGSPMPRLQKKPARREPG